MPEHVFFCGVEPHGRRAGRGRHLEVHGHHKNVMLDKLTMSRRLAATIKPRLLDLIDLGAYVFAADRTVSRGYRNEPEFGSQWRRRFKLKIALRDPDHWSQAETKRLLEDFLFSMSEDTFSFEFEQLRGVTPEADYFDFVDDPVTSGAIAPIVLFSGGLDSLAGALAELHGGRHRVILVSHRSSPIVTNHQNALVDELRQRYRDRILHVPVTMKLAGSGSQESTQRTRTFFFSCIAGAVAAAMDSPGVRFYENGIMSLNLPLSDEVVGSAATRSTHPRVLSEMSLFLEAATERLCAADNPFVFKTKADVLKEFWRTGDVDLIDKAFTCTEVRRRAGQGTHCGACLQCLVRRFGVLAAGLEQHDDASKYSLDLFESPRDGRDITMLFDLVRRARQYHQMRDREQFYQAFPLELSRLQGLGRSAEQAVNSMFQLHHRFGDEVVRVIEKGLEHFKPVLAAGRMNPHSLLTLVVGDQTGPSAGDLSRSDELAKGGRHQHKQIELLILSDRGQYSINGRKAVRAPKAVALLNKLAEHHKRHVDRFVEKIPYLATSQLERILRTNPGALRRMVDSIRCRIAIELKAGGIQNPDREAVIQSKPWKGYRLNPAVRVISK